MTLVADVLQTIREAAPHQQGVNRRLSDVILKNPARIVDASIKALAAEVGVSEPTVIRYCRSLGCLGFKDFKKVLLQSLVIEEKFSDSRRSGQAARSGAARAGAAIRAPKPGPYDAMHGNFAAAMRALNTTEAAKQIDAAARAIVKANSVVVLGLGGSSANMALEAQNRLFRLGMHVVAHADCYVQRMAAATLRNGDVMLIVSSTGRPAPLVDSAEVARHYGATCIAIAPAQSPVAALAHIVIPVEPNRTALFHHPNPVRYAQLFAIDCIAEQAALLLGEPVTKILRRISAALSPLQGLLPNQPIGD
jgi:DNA-binding MurR/RpiR family transcriptional regulator